MTEFGLNDNDVVSMTAEYSFTKTPVSKVSQLEESLRLVVKPIHPHWVDMGLPCEVLKTSGGGWQKGKIRITLEFIPDEPPSRPPDEVS